MAKQMAKQEVKLTEISGFEDSVPDLLQRIADPGAEALESYGLIGANGIKYMISKKHIAEVKNMGLIKFLEDEKGNKYIQGEFVEVSSRGFIRCAKAPKQKPYSIRG
jgi:hypothetical protein